MKVALSNESLGCSPVIICGEDAWGGVRKAHNMEIKFPPGHGKLKLSAKWMGVRGFCRAQILYYPDAGAPTSVPFHSDHPNAIFVVGCTLRPPEAAKLSAILQQPGKAPLQCNVEATLFTIEGAAGGHYFVGQGRGPPARRIAEGVPLAAPLMNGGRAGGLPCNTTLAE